MALVRLIDDPATLLEAAELWRPIRARRLAREAAHAAGQHHLCRDTDQCRQPVEHREAS